MKGLPAWSVSRPIATAMVALMVVLVGAFSLTRLPLDLLPDVSLPSLTVRVEYGTAAPEEMERLVTEFLEGSIALAEGVQEISSQSSEGSSRITVRFAWGTDLGAAADEVRERLDQVADELPEDLPRPILRRFDVSSSPIVLLGISSGMDLVELTRVVEDTVAYRIERLPGVAEVDLWGEYAREIRVELDLRRLQALGLSSAAVVGALRDANVNVPAGSVDSGRYVVTVRTPGEFQDLDQLADTVVAMRSGGPVRVRDVGTVLDTHEDVTRIVRIDGEPGLRLAVRKQSDANTAEVAKAVLAEVERLRTDLPHLNIVPVRNQGAYIERAVQNVGASVLYGGALAVLVLLLFLRNLRSTLVVAASIPVSVVATFGLVYLSGYTLNLMTLGGLALGVGMMVDSSIVVLENVYRRRQEEGDDARAAAVNGAGEVAGAILASTVTTLVIFMPLVFLGGVSGVLFGELAAVVGFSLVVSLLVALSVVPSLAARLLSRGAAPRTGRSDSLLDRLYADLLRDALARPFATTAVAGLALLATLPLVRSIGTEFLPPTDEGEVRVSGTMELGTRLDIVDRQTRRLAELSLPHVPELQSAVVSAGASGWNPDDASTGEVDIDLVPADRRQRSNVEVAEDLRRRLESQVAGMEIRTRAPQGQRLLERVIGGNDGLTVEVRGYDLATLDGLARRAAEAARGVAGVTDVRLDNEAGVPQELVRVDRRKAADLGVSVARVADTLGTAVGGTRAGLYRDRGEEHRILVRLADARNLPLESILDLTVRNDAGEDVALRNLVALEQGTGPLVIARKDQQRIASFTANVAGRDLGSVAADVQAALRAVPRPPGYEFVLAGSYAEQQRAFRDLIVVLALALALVYGVLAFQYESLRNPLVVMFSVPAAGAGVLLTLYLTGTTLNVQSYIGCILLGGIVVNNAILLVDQAERLHREGLSAAAAAAEAGRRRLRPILMTTLTTILGLLPLALGLLEGSEAQAPMARVVVGGLAFSTLVTLVLVPAVYALAHGSRAARAERAATLADAPGSTPASA